MAGINPKFEIELEVKVRVAVIRRAPSFEEALAQARRLGIRNLVAPAESWWPDEATVRLKSVKAARG